MSKPLGTCHFEGCDQPADPEFQARVQALNEVVLLCSDHVQMVKDAPSNGLEFTVSRPDASIEFTGVPGQIITRQGPLIVSLKART